MPDWSKQNCSTMPNRFVDDCLIDSVMNFTTTDYSSTTLNFGKAAAISITKKCIALCWHRWRSKWWKSYERIVKFHWMPKHMMIRCSFWTRSGSEIQSISGIHKGIFRGIIFNGRKNRPGSEICKTIFVFNDVFFNWFGSFWKLFTHKILYNSNERKLKNVQSWNSVRMTRTCMRSQIWKHGDPIEAGKSIKRYNLKLILLPALHWHRVVGIYGDVFFRCTSISAES